VKENPRVRYIELPCEGLLPRFELYRVMASLMFLATLHTELKAMTLYAMLIASFGCIPVHCL